MLTKSLNHLSQIIDPESVHKMAMLALKASHFSQSIDSKSVEGVNIKWKNRLGLAAGFDKNGAYANELSKLGFGSIEIGTVTPLAQIGNERPRIKKISKDKSILNWMGFPSDGVDKVEKNLQGYNGDAALGVNIGKNKDTPTNKAIFDYLAVGSRLKEYADYNVINVSSPNTQGLRSLENVGFLKELISEYNKSQIQNVFVKISPEINRDELRGIVKMAQDKMISGIIGTNTTVDHSYLKGGLSGERLKEKSFELIEEICSYAPKREFDLIACGGISSIEDIHKYLELDINFFQIYSSFVYKGPSVIKELLS